MFEKVCTGLVTAGLVAVCGALTYSIVTLTNETKKIDKLEEKAEPAAQ